MSKRRGLQFKICHQVANGRRNRKIIISLENEDEATLVGFFEKFYVRPLEDSQKLEELDWSPIYKKNANCFAEVCKVVFQLDKKKALGPNSFSKAVFKECWDVVKRIY